MSASSAGAAEFQGLVEHAYPRGHHLYEIGDPAEQLFVLKAGTVRLYHLTEEGRRVITDTLRPGQVCGEEALRPGSRYTTSAVTAAPTTVIAIPHRALHELVVVRPELLIMLLARLEERLVGAGERLVELATEPLSSRMAATLLREMAECACPVLDLTEQDLADMIGAYSEAALPLLETLRRQGIIRLSRGRIEVLNADLLADVRGARSEVPPDAAPDGTVTLMFTDIEGSAALTDQLGDARWLELLRAHNALIRREVTAHCGYEVKAQGDGFMVAFSSARRALLCAIAIQRAVARYSAEHPATPLRVRIGLHTGEAIREAEDFFGKHVVLAARIAAQAQGGQILVSALLKALTESAGEFTFDEGHTVAVKGLAGEHTVFGVQWAEPRAEPPLTRVAVAHDTTTAEFF
jgi:class 3 adenylate cyclase